MTEISHEMATTVIPLGTSLEALVGYQCYLSPYRLGEYHRCTRISECVVVTVCPKCGQGGMLPVCKAHGVLITKQHHQAPDQSRCPECATPMNQSEPVDYPKPKPESAARAPKELDEDWSDLYQGLD